MLSFEETKTDSAQTVEAERTKRIEDKLLEISDTMDENHNEVMTRLDKDFSCNPPAEQTTTNSGSGAPSPAKHNQENPDS